MANAFKELGIPADMIRALDEMDITKPTPIQKQVIPFLLGQGGDLVAQAQTGTGKTAAFGLPLLTKIDPESRVIQALVIAPTRELAKQIGKQLNSNFCQNNPRDNGEGNCLLCAINLRTILLQYGCNQISFIDFTGVQLRQIACNHLTTTK
jgi:superfamily II DNA/RNA helicase